MADVVVVGAGIIGCAIARELAARGLVATVVDPRPPGGGATQASAGMLAPYIEAHDRGPLLDLGVRSLDLYDEWIATVRHESGLDVEYPAGLARWRSRSILITRANCIEPRRTHRILPGAG